MNFKDRFVEACQDIGYVSLAFMGFVENNAQVAEILENSPIWIFLRRIAPLVKGLFLVWAAHTAVTFVVAWLRDHFGAFLD